MRRYLRFLPAVVWMGIIFYLSSLPSLQLTGEFSIYDTALRKVAHLLEFGVLYLLWYWATGKSKNSAVIAILYAVSDELHQSFVPTRTAEALDLLFDLLGIAIALFITKHRQLYPHRASNT